MTRGILCTYLICTMVTYFSWLAWCLINTNSLWFVACSTNLDNHNTGKDFYGNSSNFLELPEIFEEEFIARSGAGQTMIRQRRKSKHPFMFSLRSDNSITENDPLEIIEVIINKVLYGNDPEDDINDLGMSNKSTQNDIQAHYPSGHIMRAELFEEKSGVHLPLAQFMHRDHCLLKITRDYMQTAVNAFSIFLEGTVEDVLQLPPLYVLQSARTISMMNIAREKLVATWIVIKGDHETEEITYQTLEMYRPLFKYVNGREMSKLNLSDQRILSFVGTHADLDRHQVGVVASKYIKLNERWSDVKYLNLMNNLLCGVPMLFMRMLSENTYLQLSHQIFYHIRSCDPLQRRFFLHIMTRTQVLGKSNSWTASDVARLGLLLTEVDAPELAAINPQAMSGITAQVMLEMAPQNLKYLTDIQLKYIANKPLNILAKKLHGYEDELLILNAGLRVSVCWVLIILVLQLNSTVLL